MKISRLLPLLICLIVAITLGSQRTPLLHAQTELDFSMLGSGSFTLETASLGKQSRISLETDLQEVAAIVVEDIDAGIELVRLETERIQAELQARKKSIPVSRLMTDTDSIKGKFDHQLAYDLQATKTLRITMILSNGTEVPLIVTSQRSIAGRRITRTFSGKACQTFTNFCVDGTCTKTCCVPGTEAPVICSDCGPCSITCGRCNLGGGGGVGCAVTPGPQDTVAVAFDREPRPIALPKSSFFLNRTELGENDISFLMEEWAVVAYSIRPGESRPKFEVLKASSPAFAAAKAKDLDQNARFLQKRNAGGRAGSRETVLIVEAPVHPYNSRLAPTPKLSLANADVPTGMSATRVLVRADFSEVEDTPQGLEVLHADGPVPSGLLNILHERLVLDRQDIKRHRTVAFVLINVNDALELRTLTTVMPKCCCGGVHCI